MKIGEYMPNNHKQFKDLLRTNGLKVTNQRIAILEVLNDRPGEHLTAEEIYDYVRIGYPDIGLATVYRTIQLLSELNLIDKLNLDDAFQDDLLESLEERIGETLGFEVVDHEVKLYGHCKDCIEQEGNEIKSN